MVCAAGDADMHYANNSKPYLLAHLRFTFAAQQAATMAHASLSATLRPFADFYMSHHRDRRQAGLDALLLCLQGVLQQRYTAMWTPQAVAVFVIKVCTNHAAAHSSFQHQLAILSLGSPHSSLFSNTV